MMANEHIRDGRSSYEKVKTFKLSIHNEIKLDLKQKIHI
jgi:hypothetical protein